MSINVRDSKEVPFGTSLVPWSASDSNVFDIIINNMLEGRKPVQRIECVCIYRYVCVWERGREGGSIRSKASCHEANWVDWWNELHETSLTWTYRADVIFGVLVQTVWSYKDLYMYTVFVYWRAVLFRNCADNEARESLWVRYPLGGVAMHGPAQMAYEWKGIHFAWLNRRDSFDLVDIPQDEKKQKIKCNTACVSGTFESKGCISRLLNLLKDSSKFWSLAVL